MTSSVRILKNNFRKKVRRLLKEMNNLEEQSELLVSTLQNESFYKECTHCCIYLPLPGEIDLIPVLYESLELKKKVYIPVIKSFEECSMEMLRVYDKEDFDSFEKVGKYKILEPKKESIEKREKLLDVTNEIEKLLFIVPGLAFDGDMNRLGKGKGFYDRYLSRIKKENGIKEILLLSLCTDVQYYENEKVPTNQYDHPIDILLRFQSGKVISEVKKM